VALKRNLLSCAVSIVLCTAAAWSAPSDTASSNAAKTAVREADRAILQADSGAAVRALRAVPAAEFLGDDASFRACMLGRFESQAPVHLTAGIDDAWVRDVLVSYEDYWWRALAAPAQRAPLEESLLERLKTLLAAGASPTADFDALELQLGAALEKHGYHSLRGRTPPLRELMLWRAQETRQYDVALPDGPQHVLVEVLDDFISQGWNHYGNCAKSSTGGWVGKDRLFVVRPAYESLDGENFRVSFLAHEAQHFADKRRFPGLAAWELEYRAKLVELTQAAETSQKLLIRFASTQGDDVDTPHSYANRKVMTALRKALSADPRAVAVARVQRAARAILREDTWRRSLNRVSPSAIQLQRSLLIAARADSDETSEAPWSADFSAVAPESAVLPELRNQLTDSGISLREGLVPRPAHPEAVARTL
jgi:hypothetical protein